MSVASVFQFTEHKILKLHVEIPLDFSDEPFESIDYYAKYKADYGDEGWVGEVALGFRRTSASVPSNILFEVIIIGRFIFSGENTAESKELFLKFLKGSGAATLIPIARAAIVSVSALTGHPGVCTIPNINVYQMKWTDPSEEESTAEVKK